MTLERPLFWYNLRTQYENLGDLIINRECIRLLREHGDVIVNVTGVPAHFIAGLQLSPAEIRADNRAFHIGLLKGGRRSFLVLVPGAVPATLSWRELPRQLLLVLYFKLLALRGVQIIRAGVSIDELSPLRRLMEKLKSHSMAFLGPRDSASLARAKRFGMKHLHAFQDFAFLLPTAEQCPKENGAIVVSFRADSNAESDELLATIERAVECIDPDHSRFMIFVSQVDHDRKCAEMFSAHFGVDRKVVCVDHSGGVDRVFAAYAQAVCVLSNRLHVLLFALSCGAPIWALVHPERNAKIIGLFDDVGLGNRILDLSPGDVMFGATNLLEPVDPVIFSRAAADLRTKFASALSS